MRKRGAERASETTATNVNSGRLLRSTAGRHRRAIPADLCCLCLDGVRRTCSLVLACSSCRLTSRCGQLWMDTMYAIGCSERACYLRYHGDLGFHTIRGAICYCTSYRTMQAGWLLIHCLPVHCYHSQWPPLKTTHPPIRSRWLAACAPCLSPDYGRPFQCL